jgi:hypothetical protein
MTKFKLVRSTDPLKKKKPFIVIFGYPGLGKTTLSFTMPKPLHLDFDLGIDRAVQKIRPDFFSIDDYGDFHNYIMSEDFEILVREEGYKTIILDTVGTLLEDFMAPWLIRKEPKNGNNAGGLSLQGWGSLGTTFNALKSRLRSLGVMVCAVCHAKEEGDGNDKQVRLAVKGGSTDIIYRSCDQMGLIYMKGSDRVIDFNPTSQHIGKNVAGLPVTKIPDASSPTYDNFLEAQVVEVLISKMQEQSEAQIEFNKVLQEWKEILEPCKTVADFNDFIDQVKEIDEQEDKLLKVAVKKLLAVALKEKGLEYNPEAMKVQKTKKEATK